MLAPASYPYKHEGPPRSPKRGGPWPSRGCRASYEQATLRPRTVLTVWTRPLLVR